MPTESKRGPGRPRTRPDGQLLRARIWRASDAEYEEHVRKPARALGVSDAEYVRRRVIGRR
jgi:hypothetical protein